MNQYKRLIQAPCSPVRCTRYSRPVPPTPLYSCFLPPMQCEAPRKSRAPRSLIRILLKTSRQSFVLVLQGFLKGASLQEAGYCVSHPSFSYFRGRTGLCLHSSLLLPGIKVSCRCSLDFETSFHCVPGWSQICSSSFCFSLWRAVIPHVCHHTQLWIHFSRELYGSLG